MEKGDNVRLKQPMIVDKVDNSGVTVKWTSAGVEQTAVFQREDLEPFEDEDQISERL